tara:strand:+ start:55 stop:315 length:261 start_codon:yes stop_codon:yes gene_type:complete
MTTVNVTTTKNTVTITENGSSTVVQNPVTTTVTATTAGPQGPAGSNFTLNQTAKINQSVIYYDSASGEYRADDTWTIKTIVKGGDF